MCPSRRPRSLPRDERRTAANGGDVPPELRLLSAALSAAANPVVITDRNGVIEWVNPAFTRLVGYAQEEAVGRTPGELVKSGVHDAAFYRDLWRTILAGETWRGRTTNRRKDGTLYVEDQTITPVRDVAGEITHFIAVKVDVTEKERLEYQLRHAQKMHAVGQLAGGVAHDFNNLLTAMAGHAEMLLAELPADSPAREDALQILQATRRGASLTRQLLAFSRKQVVEPRVLDVRSVVTELEPMLRRLVPSRIQLALEMDDEPRTVKGDAGQLQQVVLNLVANAVDAIEGPGRISIAVAERDLDPSEAEALPWIAEPGRYVSARVRDTGVGVDPTALDHIFEPFFTTKPEGKGTGLGLATVYGIVKQGGGHVLVDSAPGAGATFEMLLPAVDGPASEETHGPEAEAGGGAVGRTVLLVEDETAVREVARRVLERAGYTVLTADDGHTALEAFERRRPPVDLVLSDIVMPGMGGVELVERLRERDPTLPIVLISGYARDEMAGKPWRESVAFLPKPFSAHALRAAVGRALDG